MKLEQERVRYISDNWTDKKQFKVIIGQIKDSRTIPDNPLLNLKEDGDWIVKLSSGNTMLQYPLDSVYDMLESDLHLEFNDHSWYRRLVNNETVQIWNSTKQREKFELPDIYLNEYPVDKLGNHVISAKINSVSKCEVCGEDGHGRGYSIFGTNPLEMHKECFKSVIAGLQDLLKDIEQLIVSASI